MIAFGYYISVGGGGGGLILSRNTRSQAQNALDDSSPMIG